MGTNQNREEQHKYDDMLELPHHVSATHGQMSVYDRAAQFAPFAALTGYGDAVSETARLTEERIELDEMEKSAMDEKLQKVQQELERRPKVRITYFQPDVKKDGGKYVVKEGHVRKLDTYEKCVIFQEGDRIPVEDIVEIETES
ncbi:MAG: hypothetical protein PHE02_06150 [Lachnospiraceae bacterium]|nr:hypothetical protein [Lachnospiraceae bacterium]